MSANTSSENTGSSAIPPFVLVVAGLTGFLALGYEILWFRVLAFATWGLPASFGILLAVYLLGIAVGSRIAGAFCKKEVEKFDPAVLKSLGIFVGVSSIAASFVGPAFGMLAKTREWPWPLGFVAIAAGLLGAVLPLLCHFGIAPDERAGSKLSYVYLANIVGSTLGSFVTGFLFLDRLPIAKVGLVLYVGGLLVAGTILARAKLSQTGKIATGIALVALLATAGPVMNKAWDRIYEKLLYKTHDDGESRFSDIIETKSGVITVTKDGTVYGGGAYDGRLNVSVVNDRNGIARAYGIGAMKPNAKKVLMIGLASGSWARVIENLPGVEDFTIVEISPGYTELISRYPTVAPILKDPRIHIVFDDGRRWLNRNPNEKFDLVVMNTTWHWRSNITNLLSQEFMELVRGHLAPGGLFYFNTTSSADAQKTAATVFPYALRVYNFVAVSDAPFSFDKERWKKILTDYKMDGVAAVDTSTEAGQKRYEDLLSYADTVHAPPTDTGLESRESILARTKGDTVVTDDNMVIEWRTVFRFPEGP